jgi:hypothetical protein
MEARKEIMSTLKQKMKELSAERRRNVQMRTEQLIGEEMTRQELRRARKQTQVRVAKELGISQDGVSRLEQRADLLLSTLRRYVKALGGKLCLIADFPDGKPVKLSGIADDENHQSSISPSSGRRARMRPCLEVRIPSL